MDENNISIFQTVDGWLELEVAIKWETVWLSQKQMATLFWVDRTVITKHIKNVFLEEELDEKSVSANFAHTAQDGKQYQTIFYNLDMIIAVWYRVNSKRATQFRIWATKIIREYIIKWFIMDDQRLKNWGKNPYFDELLERIKDIRTSERNFYQKIADIYATAVDYNPKSPETIQFFGVVQNKMHYAIHGHTAAELIYERADHNKENMWLSTFPWKKVTLKDAKVAKNYLSKDELWELNSIVSQYLDFAERQAKRHKAMRTLDWAKKLDDFITLDGGEILKGAGKISTKLAEDKLKEEYEKYNQERDKNYLSDFDEFVKKHIEK